METIMRIRTLIALGAVILAGGCADDPIAPGPERAPSMSETAAVRAVVVFEQAEGIPSGGIELVESVGGVVATRLDSIGVVFATVPSLSSLATLGSSDLVQAVGVDREENWLPGVRIGGILAADGRKEPGESTDPTQAGRWDYQWNMRQIQADRAWASGYFGSPAVKVAILDTGIDYTNRELSGLVDLSLSRSFSPEPVAVGEHPVMDYHFHGTHVSSTVVTNNITVAGVAPNVTLIGVKVLSAAGSGFFEWSIAGIVYATDVGADVISMSLGAEVDGQEDAALIESIRRAVKYAEKNRTIVIAAAGNDAADLDDPSVGVYVPCEVSSVCVSATGPLMQQNFDQPATYTNYGLSAITVAAPGGNASDTEPYVSQDLILGACSTRATQGTLVICRTSGINGYYYAYAAGTSMATPHVSGVAAMILSQSPGIPLHALKNKITEHADDLGAPGPDAYYGAGRVNVYRSLTGS